MDRLILIFKPAALDRWPAIASESQDPGRNLAWTTYHVTPNHLYNTKAL